MSQNSSLNKLSARDYWYDNAKAVLIVLVVVGHLATTDISPERDWVDGFAKFIYFFHMPVFMVISGRFSKGRIDRKDYGKAITHLLIPYLFLQTGMLLLRSAVNANTSDFSYLSPLFGLWYLFALFLYSVITPKLSRLRFLMPIALVVAVGVAFLPSSLFGAFHRTVTFYPFFLFGYYTSSYTFSFCRKKWFRCLSAIFLIALLCFTVRFTSNLRMDLFTLNVAIRDISGNKFWVTAEYFCHYAAAFICFFAFMGIMPGKKTFFSYMGVYSLYIYALHLFVVLFIRKVLVPIPLSDNVWVVLYLLSGVVLAFLLSSRPVRWLTRPFIEPKVNFHRIVETLPMDPPENK